MRRSKLRIYKVEEALKLLKPKNGYNSQLCTIAVGWFDSVAGELLIVGTVGMSVVDVGADNSA